MYDFSFGNSCVIVHTDHALLSYSAEARLLQPAQGRRIKMFVESLFDGMTICCQVIPMGRDITLAVYGGDTPHVGSVVMATARPSLSGEGLSATSSVLNGLGHKDEAVGRLFAEAVAKAKNCTAVCACGIHVDAITHDQLELVRVCCERLLRRVLGALEQVPAALRKER